MNLRAFHLKKKISESDGALIKDEYQKTSINSDQTSTLQSALVTSRKETNYRVSSAASLFLLVALSLMWGIAWPVIKIVLTEVPPLTFRMYCTIFGGLGFIVLIKTLGISLKIPKKEFKPTIIASSLNITLWYLFSAFAVANMPAGRAAIIAYTMPVWAAIWSAILLKERLTAWRFIGLFLGIAGITFLIGPDIIVFKAAPLGAVLMLCAAICWAAGVVTTKYFTWTMPTLLFTFWSLIIGGIPFIAGALVFESHAIFSPISFKCLLALVYVVLVGNILSYWAWFKILSIFPATVASIGILMTPIIGVFCSSILLAEPLGFREIAALVLVVSALVIVMILPEALKKRSSLKM